MVNFNDLSKLTAKQLRDVQNIVDGLVESDGKGGLRAKKGVTSKQLQQAKQVMQKLNKTYNEISSDLTNLRKDIGDFYKTRENLKKTMTSGKYARFYRNTSKILGLI